MGMDMLAQILGGGQNRQQYEDFVNRYDTGAPWDGISDQEAFSRYQQVAPQLSPQMYQESAQEAFSQLTPQQRLQLGQHLQQQTRQQGLNVPDLNQDGIDDRLQDPAYLAQATGQLQQQQPGILGDLLGGGGGGGGQSMLQSPIAKAALAGIAAMAVKKMMSGR
jgi:hypothetical protein